MQMPPLDAQTGFHKTLNAMGGMTPELDKYGEAFVAFAAEAPGAVLDVGAAYGVATLAALENGARVIANDIEPRHLDILLTRVPEAQRERVSVLPGAFPDDLKLEAGSLGAVLLARMLHFLDGDAIERGLKQVHGWLAPGGKVFGVAVTPYLAKLADFRPQFEARRAAGERWPGLVTDVHALYPEGAETLPPLMNFLDVETLTRAMTAAGFEVELVEYGTRPAFISDMALDGREMVGFIARRPEV